MRVDDEARAVEDFAVARERRFRIDGVLVLIVVMAALLRFWRLGSQSFWKRRG
jgi:hypothetical protein